ncbi:MULTISPECIES: hypothetical protein [Flavobacterium]|uniref:Uncharacterized protein n=1 Tax=Flavobacterium columnare TaxID=996 RepID=A0AA94JRH1_9FLAO|nr:MULTISPECIES: hypothetical protein [Flavobacterium]MCH4830024.1 hypothetical protein [Flavobacterium columnare]MCH4832595.1 hypothetical protein [Flavobacterium columnare]OWP85479.1 hypothetical protein BWK60_13885 [Flavobacterium covae]
MEYTIVNRQINISDKKYWILSGELNNYTIKQLNQTISDMEDVFNGKYPSSSFYGEVVFCVEYDKSKAKIEYYSEYVSEEPTLDIYNMLKDFRDKLIKYESEQNI